MLAVVDISLAITMLAAQAGAAPGVLVELAALVMVAVVAIMALMGLVLQALGLVEALRVKMHNITLAALGLKVAYTFTGEYYEQSIRPISSTA